MNGAYVKLNRAGELDLVIIDPISAQEAAEGEEAKLPLPKRGSFFMEPISQGAVEMAIYESLN